MRQTPLQNKKDIKDFFNFTIEVSYQPINKMWGALIKRDSGTTFEIDENLIVAIDKSLNRFAGIIENK